MITETDLAYLAGFIDGEGCFFIGMFWCKTKSGNKNLNYHTYIKITNTDHAVMEWIKDTFNGTNYGQWRSTDRARKHEKKISHIQFTGKTLDEILPKLLPYLKVKKRQAEIMIKMRSTFIYGKRLSKHPDKKDIHDFRYQCMVELRKLNSRFHSHPLKQPYALAPCCPSAKQLGGSSPLEKV